MTVPHTVVREWKLQAGARLLIRATDEGILLYPAYFGPFLRRPRVIGKPIAGQPKSLPLRKLYSLHLARPRRPRR